MSLKKSMFKNYKELKEAVDIWCWNLSHGWTSDISKEWYNLMLKRKFERERKTRDFDNPCKQLLEQKDRHEEKMRLKKNEIEKKYGHISDWNVRGIKTMEKLFAFKHEFNENISKWDVSNVKNMSYMFYKCLCFDSPLNNWDVSNVSDMSYMFDGCQRFNRPLHRWNTSNVKTMKSMFSDCNAFNQLLNTHDEMIREVDYRYVLMRDVCNDFKKPNGLNTLIPEIMSHLTYKAWDVSSCKYMDGMFTNCHIFNKSLSHWNTKNTKNMCRMFQGCYTFNQPLSSKIVRDLNGEILYKSWDVSNVENMLLMFSWARKFNQNLNDWNVNKAKNASLLVKMFFAADRFEPNNIKKWNYSNELLIFT